MIRRAHRTSIADTLIFAIALAQPLATFAAETKAIELPAQPLAQAIQSMARQASVNILVDPKLVAGLNAPALNARLTVEQALTRLLQGTGLTSQYVDEKTVVVVPSATSAAAPVAKPTTQIAAADKIHLAQADAKPSTDSQAESPAAEEPSPSRERAAQRPGIEEVLVTGTLIHRADPLSPVITITHDDMVKRGYTRLDKVIEQLPQNFKDGASPESSPNSGHGANAAFNASRASGINLRGFGANATLVLLNGERMAMANSGDSVDISMIPVSIIERVEILTDGASAIYGADAVAGVVNIITRDDFSGAEFGARLTTISEGKGPNYGGYVLGGYNWPSGNLIVNYDYEKDRPLLARNRTVTATAGDPNSVLPEQEITSVYSALRQRLVDHFSFSADVRSARRDYDVLSTNAEDGYQARFSGTSEQSAVSSQLDYENAQWHASLAGHYAAERGLTNYLDLPPEGGSTLFARTLNNRDSGFDARVDGPLFDYFAGTARIAVGATYRAEAYSEVAGDVAPEVSSELQQRSRHARSVFGELLVPLLGAQNDIALVESLTLDIAGRYDRYSDFGSTFNPKFALKWQMPAGLALHAVYGRSFRTPTLFETIPSAQNGAYVIDVPDPLAPAGTSRVLIYLDPNPNLQPERSRSINLGLRYAPESTPELKVDLSYFDVRFANKIIEPLRRGFFTNVLTDADRLGSLVVRDPALDAVNAILTEPGQIVLNLNDTPFTPEQIEATANLGYINAAVDHPRGFDLAARYGRPTLLGHFSLSGSAAYFLEYQTQIAPDTPQFSGIEKAYLPTRWRGQVTLAWNRSVWSAYSRINYTSAYDTRIQADPACPGVEGCAVPAWTTVDAGLSLSTAAGPDAGLLGGVRLGLDVSNALDREAPYVFQCVGCYNYDSTNANPLQRTFSVTLTKAFSRCSGHC